MWIVITIGIGAFALWYGNKRRGQRFVRAVHFLDMLDNGANPDEANGKVARLFTKHSTPETDVAAIEYATDKADRMTGGKQLPWINEARERGFAIDSGNQRYDMAHLSSSTDLGEKVGHAVRNQITLSFTSAFAPIPERLFLDPYIAGYASKLIAGFASVMGAPSKQTPEQLGCMFDVAVKTAVGPKLFRDFMAIDQNSIGFVKGQEDGAMLTWAMFAPDMLDKNDTLVAEAYQLAKDETQLTNELDGMMSNAGFSVKGSENATPAGLAMAVASLTLERYCKEQFHM
ncbi:hypothetical protein [Rhodophyticola porphyridii]|uniref:hypothetical protein n=1 Tax=Rhodophyticola porphyridii TaxID=1852017 RepID=UPI0035CFD9C6